MTSSPYDPAPGVALTATDIYRAADEGVLARADADRLLRWAFERRAGLAAPPAEAAKGLNFVTAAYYFGAMLMILACAWFLGDKWDALGSPGVLATTLVYAALAAGAGWWLRRNGYPVAGGLLVTVAVSLTPLVTYSVEDILGVWPGEHPGDYDRFYPWVHGSWIVMELATIAAAALALRFVPFAFLTAPMAFSFWFLSMDVAALALRREALYGDERNLVSILVGAVTILVGYGLDRGLRRRGAPRSEDFAFWCYLFGLMAAWGGLTAMDSDSEAGKLLYALLNVGLIALGVWMRRATFVVFGVIGVHIYLGHLAYEIFKDSVLFPFSLAGLGLSVILVTVWLQRRLRRGGPSAGLPSTAAAGDGRAAGGI